MDTANGIAAVAALLLAVAGALYFGFPRDRNFDNPVYVSCIKNGHAPTTANCTSSTHRPLATEPVARRQA